jgi:ribosomal protein S18 acetylase RimI-like enzyme
MAWFCTCVTGDTGVRCYPRRFRKESTSRVLRAPLLTPFCIFGSRTSSADDATATAPLPAADVSFFDRSFQPHEIRRRRENRRLLNEMFLAYELRMATDEDRKEYEKFKEKMEKRGYRELKSHPRGRQPHQQHHEERFRAQSKYQPGHVAQPENPHPRHSYSWEKEEYSRRHSQQYNEQKQIQRAFIEGNLSGPGAEISGEYAPDYHPQESKQPHRSAWPQKSIRRPGRNEVVPSETEDGGFHQYQGYYQNPYLHDEPLVMGGNLGGTTARAGRQPPSPDHVRRPRHRTANPFPPRGVGSTGPLFAHDPFLSSVFGHEDDVPHRGHQAHEWESHRSRTSKGAPSNNHIWGVEGSYQAEVRVQESEFGEEYSSYYDYGVRSAPRREAASSHSHQPEEEEHRGKPERELFRDAVQSSREQNKQAQERSQQQHFYEEGDKLYVRGPLVGFVEVSNIPYNLGRVEDLEYAKAGMRSPKRAVVSHLGVEEHARKSGIGSRLLEACERHAQIQWNAKELILEVEEGESGNTAEDPEKGLEVIEFLNRRGFTILFAEPASQRYDVETGEVLQQIQRRKDVMSKRLVGKNRIPVDPENHKDIFASETDEHGKAVQPHRDSQYHTGHDIVDVEYFESVEVS